MAWLSGRIYKAQADEDFRMGLYVFLNPTIRIYFLECNYLQDSPENVTFIIGKINILVMGGEERRWCSLVFLRN